LSIDGNLDSCAVIDTKLNKQIVIVNRKFFIDFILNDYKSANFNLKIARLLKKAQKYAFFSGYYLLKCKHCDG